MFRFKSEDVAVRRETVRLFGNLFGDMNSRMAEDEPEVWKEYIKRFVDADEEIRRICVRNAEDILVFHPELRGQVTGIVGYFFLKIISRIGLKTSFFNFVVFLLAHSFFFFSGLGNESIVLFTSHLL